MYTCEWVYVSIPTGALNTPDYVLLLHSEEQVFRPLSLTSKECVREHWILSNKNKR